MSRLAKISVALIILGLIALGLAELPSWFWHPLGLCSGSKAVVRGCKGYNSWSGIFSDVGEATLIVGLISGSVAIRRFLHQHFECHDSTCKRLGFHRVENTPFRTCWHHHPILGRHEKHLVPLEHIHAAHKEALKDK
jgi:hypothetical protein